MNHISTDIYINNLDHLLMFLSVNISVITILSLLFAANIDKKTDICLFCILLFYNCDNNKHIMKFSIIYVY